MLRTHSQTGLGVCGRVIARTPAPASPRHQHPVAFWRRVSWALSPSQCLSIFLSPAQQSVWSSCLFSVSVPSTSAMSLLYECVNTVIAGESPRSPAPEQMALIGGRPSPGPRWHPLASPGGTRTPGVAGSCPCAGCLSLALKPLGGPACLEALLEGEGLLARLPPECAAHPPPPVPVLLLSARP